MVELIRSKTENVERKFEKINRVNEQLSFLKLEFVKQPTFVKGVNASKGEVERHMHKKYIVIMYLLRLVGSTIFRQKYHVMIMLLLLREIKNNYTKRYLFITLILRSYTLSRSF